MIQYIEVCTNSLHQLDMSFYSQPHNILSIFIIIGYCNRQHTTEFACNA